MTEISPSPRGVRGIGSFGHWVIGIYLEFGIW